MVRRLMTSASMPSAARAFGGLEGDADHDGVGDDGDVGAGSLDLGAADLEDEVLIGRDVEGLAVEHLVFEEDDRIGVFDGGAQQALGVGGAVGREDEEAGAVGIPGGIVLAVLGADAGGGAIGAAEDDGAAHLAAGHIEGFGGGVDDVIDRLHGEVEGHELDDWLESVHGGTDGHAGEAVFGDGGVDDAAGAELVEQALADLVGALVLGDLLAEQEDAVVSAELERHGVAKGFADGGGLGRAPVLFGRGGSERGGGRGWSGLGGAAGHGFGFDHRRGVGELFGGGDGDGGLLAPPPLSSRRSGC